MAHQYSMFKYTVTNKWILRYIKYISNITLNIERTNYDSQVIEDFTNNQFLNKSPISDFDLLMNSTKLEKESQGDDFAFIGIFLVHRFSLIHFPSLLAHHFRKNSGYEHRRLRYAETTPSYFRFLNKNERAARFSRFPKTRNSHRNSSSPELIIYRSFMKRST